MIPYSKRTLDNGLEVIVHEDHHAPLVAVSLWYHTGSKNERVGRTGLAHLFEHLMFEGGAHQPRGFFEPLQEAGAALNGSTSTDRTNYWEVVPKEALRLALWMEADRMGWLVPVLTQARFDTQRDVVINPTLGATYEISPKFSVGIDSWLRGEYPTNQYMAPATRPFALGPEYYVGPALMMSFGKIWWTAAMYVRATDFGETPPVGSYFGQVWFRSMFGYNL